MALDVTHVLDEVPPHLIADQLVAEARRAAGRRRGALYVVDIDGSRLIRLAGSEDFPETLDAPPALGPEIVPGGPAGLLRAAAGDDAAVHRRRRCGCAAACSACSCASAMPLVELEDIATAGRRRARAGQRLHGPHRVGPPPQADHGRRRGPASPAPPAHRAGDRRAARGRPAAQLRGRRRLVRLRREPRRRVAGDRRRRRHGARPPPAWAPPRSARCARPAARAKTCVQAATLDGRRHPRARRPAVHADRDRRPLARADRHARVDQLRPPAGASSPTRTAR